jgi:hypothetical protein
MNDVVSLSIAMPESSLMVVRIWVARVVRRCGLAVWLGGFMARGGKEAGKRAAFGFSLWAGADGAASATRGKIEVPTRTASTQKCFRSKG